MLLVVLKILQEVEKLKEAIYTSYGSYVLQHIKPSMKSKLLWKVNFKFILKNRDISLPST